MFDRPVPEPRYWKALIATGLFVVPLALLTRILVHMPDMTWLLLTIGITSLLSWGVYGRMRDDWRARGTMNAGYFDHRTTVARNIKIRRR